MPIIASGEDEIFINDIILQSYYKTDDIHLVDIVADNQVYAQFSLLCDGFAHPFPCQCVFKSIYPVSDVDIILSYTGVKFGGL